MKWQGDGGTAKVLQDMGISLWGSLTSKVEVLLASDTCKMSFWNYYLQECCSEFRHLD